MIRRFSLAALCAASVFSSVAFADATYRFNLPSQPMSDALKAIGQQTAMNILFEPGAVRNITAQALNANLTANEAVSRILAGTDLTAEQTAANTILVQSEKKAQSSSVSGGDTQIAPVAQDASVMRLAQSETTQSPAAPAVGKNKDSTTVQEIVVTAQKQQERLHDVPISITALSGEQLDHSRAQGITEALSRVPGVAVYEAYQGGGTTLTVRGVGPNGPYFSGASPIAYYLDGMSFGLMRSAIVPDPSGYDLERVEVLRGPQGTLYGAGGVAGVVRVLTKEPNLQQVEFKARTSVSNTEGGTESYRGDVALSVPLIEDKLAFRAVAGYNDLSGWIDSPNIEDINSSQIGNFRGKLRFQPTEDLKLGLSAWVSRTHYDSLPQSDINGRIGNDFGTPTDTDFNAYSFTLDKEFSAVSIASSTNYLDYKNHYDQDLHILAPILNGVSAIGDAKVFSQEILLSSTSSGPWTWTAGAFYRDERDRTVQTLAFVDGFLSPADGSVDPSPIDNFVDKSKSYAVYGELNRRFLDDRFKLTLGLRYFSDDSSTQGSVADPNRYTSTSNATTPRVVLTWLPNRDLTAYASYSEGFRSGFPQTELVTQTLPQFLPVKPDKLHNYEIGTKVNFLDNRLSTEAAVYYMDWKGIQNTLLVNFGAVSGPGMINGTSASGLGFDFSITARPIEGLEIGAAISQNDLTQDADVISGTTLLIPKGARTGNSPETTLMAFADYVFPAGSSGYQTRLSASANYTSPQALRTVGPSGQVLRAADSDALTVGRASIALEAPKNWVATIYAENINNEDGFPGAPAAAPDWQGRIRPRQVGLQFEYKY